MRRVFLPLFLLPLLAWGQSPPKALLWKIGGNGLERDSYVVGTVHSRDARAYGQADRLLEVVEGLDVVAGELDITAAGEMGMQMIQTMMMPPDTQLADLYNKRKLKQVKKAVTEELGVMAMFADRIKPFFLIGLLNEANMNADSAMVLDQYLQEKAKAMGKEVMGVETMQEQLAAVDALSLQEQADMLYEAVRKGGQQKEMDRLMNVYAQQDLEGLHRLMTDAGMPDAFNKSLLTGRNEVMADRMDGLLRDGRTFLFALGALHLPGEHGVIKLLREKGYTVEPDTGGR